MNGCTDIGLQGEKSTNHRQAGKPTWSEKYHMMKVEVSTHHSSNKLHHLTIAVQLQSLITLPQIRAMANFHSSTCIASIHFKAHYPAGLYANKESKILIPFLIAWSKVVRRKDTHALHPAIISSNDQFWKDIKHSAIRSWTVVKTLLSL